MNKENPMRERKIEELFSLNNLFLLAYKWRKFLIINTTIITAVSIGVSLVLTVWFKSTATILPPVNQSGAQLGGLSSIIQKLPVSSMNFGGISSGLGAYNYMAIFKSRRVSENIITKFHLIKEYQIPDSSMERAVEALMDNVSFSISDDGYIQIDVLDTDPNRAAEMANTYIELLNEISLEFSQKEATYYRKFIEKRYRQNRADIEKYKMLMKDFQTNYGVIDVPNQIAATVNSLAELNTLLIQKEIKLNVLRKVKSQNDPLVSYAKTEYNEIQNSILELSTKADTSISFSDILIPLDSAPQIASKYFTIYRNLEIQYKIAEFLIPIYEQAKIDEQKIIPAVLVLDKAVPAERKSKPRRAYIVLGAFVASLLLGFVFVMFLEYYQLNIKTQLKQINKI